MVSLVRENVYEIGNIKYYTNKLLGAGENSIVYRGKFGQSQIIAIKIVTINSTETQKKYKERLKHEENHLKRCVNDNIIKFYGWEEAREGNSLKLYLAWERCNGSLQDFVDGTYQGDSLGSIKHILTQISSGLHYMHSKKVIHCDLRPANLWISHPVRGIEHHPKIKITGFEFSQRIIARTGEDEDISSDTTNALENRTDDSLGWLDPLAHSMPCDYEYGTSSDIFSFGLVCGFTASGGRHPFGETNENRIRNLKKENYDMSVFDRLDPCLLDLIERTIFDDRLKSFDKIMDHPYFWTDKRCLDYLISVHNDKLSDKNSSAINKLSLEIKPVNKNIVLNNTDWVSQLDVKIRAIVVKYDGDSVVDLIRFIRNKSEHYGELDKDVKTLVGPKPEEGCSDENQPVNYFQFWAKTFPHLLIHTWRQMEKKPRKKVPSPVDDSLYE